MTFNNALEKLRTVLSKELNKTRVLDKDVAKALNIPQMTFTSMKKRGSIPYKEVMDFCADRGISINWLFYGQTPIMLKED